jgi:hypothetical protein
MCFLRRLGSFRLVVYVCRQSLSKPCRRMREGRVGRNIRSRVSEVLPACPVGDDDVRSRRYDECSEVLVMRVLCNRYQELEDRC